MTRAEIVFNEKEALRYFRAAPEDEKAQAVVRQVYEQLKTELQPRYTVRKFGCRVYTEKELLQQCPEYEVAIRERKQERGNSLAAPSATAERKKQSAHSLTVLAPPAIVAPEKGSTTSCWNRTVSPAEDSQAAVVVLSNGTLFYSRALARYLGACKELYLFGATLGSRIDIALRRLALISVTQGAAAQAVAAALIESYCDACCQELQGQLAPDKTLKPRFSPGYGDWKLEEQRILFPVLDCAHTIGLTLTESCMMAPVKSVTAIVGIEERKEPFSVDCRLHDKCRSCGKADCEFRR